MDALAAGAGSGSEATISTEAAREAMRRLEEEFERQRAEQARIERELAAVEIDATSTELIADQFDLSKKDAERALRAAGGNVDVALARLAGVVPDTGLSGASEQATAFGAA